MHESAHSDEIGFVGALMVLKRRWRIVTLCVVLCALGGAGYGIAQTPTYSATAILLAGQDEGIADVTAIAAVNQATQSLARMSTNRVVLEDALTRLDLDGEIDPVELGSRTSANVPANTQQVEITVRDENAARAARLANGVATTFSELVDEKAGKKSNLSATVWQPAIAPRSPSSPNIPMLVVLGLIGGLVLGAALAALREALDVRWHDERALEDALGVPVLAVIPEVTRRTARRKVYA